MPGKCCACSIIRDMKAVDKSPIFRCLPAGLMQLTEFSVAVDT
jgi:hypothetical protein